MMENYLPWSVGDYSDELCPIRDTRGRVVADTGFSGSVELDKYRARRIVAEARACAGISTKNLEDNAPVKELAHRYNAVIKQRDDLLAALKRLNYAASKDSPNAIIVRDAIAAAEKQP